MKIFDGRWNNQIIAIIIMMHGLLLAEDTVNNNFFFKDTPSQYLPAYENSISEVSYFVGSDNQIGIVFSCEKNPICIYTPLTYEDLDQKNGTKTYYLPFTSCTKDQLRYFSQHISELLDKVGILFSFEGIKKNRGLHFLSKSYGLRISFSIKSQRNYDIVKIINDKNKTISFNIVEKI